jgi:hypothetical protein
VLSFSLFFSQKNQPENTLGLKTEKHWNPQERLKNSKKKCMNTKKKKKKKKMKRKKEKKT